MVIFKKIRHILKINKAREDFNRSFSQFKKEKANILIHVYGAHNVSYALSAAFTLFGEDVNIVAIVTPLSKGNQRTVYDICKKIPQIKYMHTITCEKINELEKLEYKDWHIYFQKNIPQAEYQALVYSHDINNHLINILNQLYKDIKLISYGDAFGLYFNKYDFLKNLGIEYKKPEKFKCITSQEFCSILPTDMGNVVDKQPIIVAKECFKDILKKISPKNLQKYEEKLLLNYINKTKALLMTENLAEGGIMSYREEIQMYIDFIEKYVPKNSVIFVKAHPHEIHDRARDIKKRMKKYYKIVKIENRYNFYPMEIFANFIDKMDIIICNGSPIITFKYLYNKDVINPRLDPHYSNSYHFTTNLDQAIDKAMEETLKLIDNWDGKTVIYKR